ncbi:MAG: DUF2341 domain-containing protein, partial [Candidatus Parvarchaeota archaeon]|nr:DUF2341 domain-containing protein [Candidatus Jingweiarchaeum tengchongense]
MKCLIKILLVLLCLFIIFNISHAVKFNYRYTITIDNTQNSNTLTDYQIRINVNTQSLISSGYMRSNCGDIRFSDVDNFDVTTNFSYWIKQETCNTPNTEIWVKVPNIPANSNKTIYMYFGNSSVSSISNGDNVFIFFDDFDGSSLNTSKWNDYSSPYLSVSGGSVELWGSGGTRVINSTSSFPTTNMLEFESEFEISGTLNNWVYQGFRIYQLIYIYKTTTMNLYCDPTNWVSISYDSSKRTWGIVRVGNTLYLYKDYNLLTSVSCSVSTTSVIEFQLQLGGGSNFIDIFSVRMRKFSLPEPIITVNTTMNCDPSSCSSACGASAACLGKAPNQAYRCTSPSGCSNTKGEPTIIPYNSTYYCASDCSAYDADALIGVYRCLPYWGVCGGIFGKNCFNLSYTGPRCASSGDVQYSAYGCNQYCCIDDPNEYILNTTILRNQSRAFDESFQRFIQPSDTYGCGNKTTYCVYENRWYENGTTPENWDAICYSNGTSVLMGSVIIDGSSENRYQYINYWVSPDDYEWACSLYGQIRGIPTYWNMPNVRYPYCCGDDEGEYPITLISNNTNFESFRIPSFTSCCAQPYSCSYENEQIPNCYPNGTRYPNKDAICWESTWHEIDDSKIFCDSISKVWLSGDKFGPGTYYTPSIGYGCCGDDNEYYLSRVCSSGVCVNNTSDIACCNASNSCVYDSVCYSDGSSFNLGGNIIFCSGGVWSNPDISQSYCTLSGLTWIPFDYSFEFGNEKYCCGDDPLERLRHRECAFGANCETNTSDIACCNSTNKCVFDNTCYPSGYCYNGINYCNVTHWIDPDTNLTTCSTCNRIWISNSTTGSCCGDDGINDNFGIITGSNCSYCNNGNYYTDNQLYLYNGTFIGNCNYNSIEYNCSNGYYYNSNNVNCYYSVSCGSNGWRAGNVINFCPRNNSIYYTAMSIWLYNPNTGWYGSLIDNIPAINAQGIYCYLST